MLLTLGVIGRGSTEQDKHSSCFWNLTSVQVSGWGTGKKTNTERKIQITGKTSIVKRSVGGAVIGQSEDCFNEVTFKKIVE